MLTTKLFNGRKSRIISLWQSDSHSQILYYWEFFEHPIYMLANVQTKKCMFASFYKIIILVASFAGQSVINKDPSIWQDGARPASTCIPPSFLGNGNAKLFGIPTKKVRLWVYKNGCLQALNEELNHHYCNFVQGIN